MLALFSSRGVVRFHRQVVELAGGRVQQHGIRRGAPISFFSRLGNGLHLESVQSGAHPRYREVLGILTLVGEQGRSGDQRVDQPCRLNSCYFRASKASELRNRKGSRYERHRTLDILIPSSMDNRLCHVLSYVSPPQHNVKSNNFHFNHIFFLAKRDSIPLMPRPVR